MERIDFIKTIFGASMLLTMDGFSSLVNGMTNLNQSHDKLGRFASYGAIHLNNTSLERSTTFWTKMVGMKLRKSSANIAEFGTEKETLVVVHQTAKTGFRKGFSGLYHFAIHAPNAAEFASMTNRLIANNYPFSPVDHTMSKSIYLDDPDGINVEFTLETPERFKRVVTRRGRGINMEDADGNIRSASDYLDVEEVLKGFTNLDVNQVISDDTYLGHVHLYANNVEQSNTFYKQLGFLQFNNLPEFLYADLGAGGAYQHRVALNSWHGINRPLAPSDTAGMRHFHIVFQTQEKLKQALSNITGYEEQDGGYWVFDPTGNKVFITSNESKER